VRGHAEIENLCRCPDTFCGGANTWENTRFGCIGQMAWVFAEIGLKVVGISFRRCGNFLAPCNELEHCPSSE